MNKKMDRSATEREEKFLKDIERKEKRKIKAQSKKNRAIWMGLGLFGVIGWSVMIPKNCCYFFVLFYIARLGQWISILLWLIGFVLTRIFLSRLLGKDSLRYRNFHDS
jgi:predicted F0F1-ATPase subunit